MAVVEERKQRAKRQFRVQADPNRPCWWCLKPLGDGNPYKRYHADCFTEHRNHRGRKCVPPTPSPSPAPEPPPVRNEGPDPMRPCQICGEPLNTSNRGRKYHSGMCARLATYRRNRKGISPFRRCPECGEPLNFGDPEMRVSPIRQRHEACEKKYRTGYRRRYGQMRRDGKIVPRTRKGAA